MLFSFIFILLKNKISRTSKEIGNSIQIESELATGKSFSIESDSKMRKREMRM